jgi:hypothetical protein
VTTEQLRQEVKSLTGGSLNFWRFLNPSLWWILL